MSQAGVLRATPGVLPGNIPISFITDAGTATSANHILNINGTTSTAGTLPISTSGSGNTIDIISQFSQAIAATDATKVGLASFDSSAFNVDANGFVTIIGSSSPLARLLPQTGTTPVIPSGGSISISGAVVAAGTNPIRSDGTGANTLTLEVQKSQSLAAADATKIGLSNFNSANFSVDANGFVSLASSGPAMTITGDTGGALSTTANNWNILGSGSITTSGSVSTLTVELQNLTNHNVLIGAGTTTITKVAPSATSGVALISQGAAADPVFGTVVVAGGGTGQTTLTNHAVLLGQGTSAIGSVGPSATAGQILQSAGAAADPVFSTATYPATTTVSQILYSSSTNVVSGLATANRAVLTTGATGVPVLTALATDGQLIIGSTAGVPAAATLTAGSGVTITNASNSITIAVNGSTVAQTITGDTGGALSPTAGNWNLLGSGSITTSGSGSTLTTQLTGLTNHSVLVGAGTSTITKVAPSATSGVPLISQGASADPIFGTAAIAGGGTGVTTTPSNGQLLIGNGTGYTVANLTAGTGITITNSAGGIMISSTASPIPTLTFLSTQTASSSTSLDFNNTIITSTYKAYLFLINSIVLSVNNTFEVKLSTDNLSTFVTLNAVPQIFTQSTANNSTMIASSSSSVIILPSGGAQQAIQGQVELFYPTDSTINSILEFNVGDQSSGRGGKIGIANDAARQAVNSIRFTTGAGNFSTGSITCYGVS